MVSLETKLFISWKWTSLYFQDGFQIRSQSQNRMGERGCKASFCVQYLGENDELCQEQGEITLTYNSNPAMRMTLLFSISN